MCRYVFCIPLNCKQVVVQEELSAIHSIQLESMFLTTVFSRKQLGKASVSKLEPHMVS
jgi:hypothetical protein